MGPAPAGRADGLAIAQRGRGILRRGLGARLLLLRRLLQRFRARLGDLCLVGCQLCLVRRTLHHADELLFVIVLISPLARVPRRRPAAEVIVCPVLKMFRAAANGYRFLVGISHTGELAADDLVRRAANQLRLGPFTPTVHAAVDRREGLHDDHVRTIRYSRGLSLPLAHVGRARGRHRSPSAL